MLKIILQLSFILLCIVSSMSAQVSIKDGTKILLEVGNESFAGSLILHDVQQGLGGYKLYRWGNDLYWGINKLGTTSNAGGWTHSGTSIYNTVLSDNVGIGTSSPSSKLSVGGSGNSVYTIYGESASSAAQVVYGYASNSGAVANIGGIFKAAGTAGKGVYGFASKTGIATNYGGYFWAQGDKGYGVYGLASNSSSAAQNYGGYFKATGGAGYGVYSIATHTATTIVNTGGFFRADGNAGRGVWGEASNNGNGYNFGGYFVAKGSNGRGIYAEAPSTGLAGLFGGNVSISGTLSKGGGSFKIDHPLDPTNKNLYHSFVESPDMMNIYNGNVELNANGEAIVELAEWFEALNMEFRYQLTCIGGFAPVYIAEKINGNKFKIAGGKPGIEISWQVTGIRQDAFANKNRIPVEEMKKDKERGKYLHPEAFNMPKTAGVDYGERYEEID